MGKEQNNSQIEGKKNKEKIISQINKIIRVPF